MNYILASLLLTCPAPTIINKTNTWSNFDTETLNRATKRCPEIFEGTCLKTFIKKEELLYNAICGNS